LGTFLINLSLGSLTPPFGYDLFTLKALMPHFETKLIFGAAWRIVVIIVLGMALFFLVPGIITFVPSLM
jgi:TRAP-type C4-dicarboxylate transport system permease large subunit